MSRNESITNCIHTIGVGIRPNGERYLMPCKRWNCPICAAILKNKLLDQVNLYFSGEQEVYFYTFTEQAESGRDIMADLRRFRKTLYHGLKVRVPGTQRKWITRWKPRPKVKAFYVKEFTKRGVRHIHMISTFHMDNEELSQRWRYATYGVSDQAKVTDKTSLHSPAGYMMKYMGKQLDEDKEQFYDGEYQFKKHERRTGFWKPEGIDHVPRVEWKEAPQEGDTIEVELGHQWNIESAYWESWYKDLSARWGEPFTRYMEYSTLNPIQQAHVTGATIDGETNYDYVPEEREPDNDLLKRAHAILKAKQDLTLVNRLASAQCLQKVEQS